jgi:AsmA family protein
MDIHHLKLSLEPHKKSLICLILSISFILVFDWDWCRPALERYLSHRSHRIVKATSLNVELSWTLKPTIRVKNVYVENAAWSDKRPFINAKEIAITFSGLKTIFDEKHVVSEIYLSDAEVNLERLEDGLRNWRLTQPNYKGSGNYKLLSLRANRSIIRFNNRAIKFNGVMAIRPALNQADEALFKDAQKLSNVIEFKGNYRNIKFDGLALTSELLTFQKTKILFPIQGHLNTPHTHIVIKGNVGDVYLDQLFDADVKVTGESIAEVLSLIKLPPTPSRNYDFNAHLLKSGDNYHATNIQGKVGDSDIKGSLHYDRSDKHPSITGSISSQTINLNDIPTFRHKSTSESTSEFFRNGNIVLSYKIDQLIGNKLPKLSNLNIPIDFKNGYLRADSVTGTVDTGKFKGNFIVDSTKSPRVASSYLEIHQIPINSLLINSKYQGKIFAPLSGKIELQGEGESIAQISKTLSGNLLLTLGEGRISSKLDAKLGLDFGQLFWLSIKGDKNTHVNCGVLKGYFKKGVFSNTQMIFETAETSLNGHGSVDFLHDRIDLTLIHETSRSKLLSLSSPIHVHGAIRNPTIDLQPDSRRSREDKSAIQRCASS